MYPQTFYSSVRFCFCNAVCILHQARTDPCDPTQKGSVVSREPPSLGRASASESLIIGSFVIHGIIATELFSTVCGRSFVYCSERLCC